MGRAKIKFQRGAIRKMLTSPEARADIQRRAEAVAQACNSQSSWGGYEASQQPGRNRARSIVWTIEGEAVADNARNNRIVRNLGAGS